MIKVVKITSIGKMESGTSEKGAKWYKIQMSGEILNTGNKIVLGAFAMEDRKEKITKLTSEIKVGEVYEFRLTLKGNENNGKIYMSIDIISYSQIIKKNYIQNKELHWVSGQLLKPVDASQQWSSVTILDSNGQLIDAQIPQSIASTIANSNIGTSLCIGLTFSIRNYENHEFMNVNAKKLIDLSANETGVQNNSNTKTSESMPPKAVQTQKKEVEPVVEDDDEDLPF